MNNWIEISETRLNANFRALQAAAGQATELLAVVKADAYGHGAEHCAPMLVRAGARWLGVTCASEGARVRSALSWQHLNANIVIMCGFLPEDVPQIVQHSLIPVVWTLDHLHWLGGTHSRVHVEVDTGMGRQGVRPSAELDELLQAIAASDLVLDGVFTHFCCSEDPDLTFTHTQQRRFATAISQLREAAVRPKWVHAGNSSALDNPAETPPWLAPLAASIGAKPMVRAGLALYGYCLPTATPKLRHTLAPVLTWKANILAVRALAPGETVGYSATFTADSPMRVALLGVGYADGLRRELSGTGYVLIDGQQAKILGRISMNLTVVDVTAIPGAAVNTAATLLGDTLTADDHAAIATTIAYEILCGIHPCG